VSLGYKINENALLGKWSLYKTVKSHSQFAFNTLFSVYLLTLMKLCRIFLLRHLEQNVRILKKVKNNILDYSVIFMAT